MTQTIIHHQNGYESAVAELRRIADALETVPAGFGPSYVGLSIHAGRSNQTASIAAVDAVAMAVIGKVGTTQRMGNGTYHHDASSYSGPVDVGIFQRVPSPADSELERLRAEVEALKAANARLDEQATGDDSRIVHYLEPGSDGDDDDRMACGQRFRDAVKTGAYTGVPGDVTCSGCRLVADEWSE